MGYFGLLGERLSHSYSPMIHAELGDYEYKLFEKKPEELAEFLRYGDFTGINVTIPYKKAVIPFCDKISETASAIGSVNTITRFGDHSLYGDNTDYFGFSYLLKKTRADPAAGKTIILGGGGSSLTAQAVLRDLNAREVVVVSRSGVDNYENIENHSDAIVMINTTPVGMYPNNGVSPIASMDVFQNCKIVIDMIYNPLRTELLLQAEERGVLCVNGLTMLVAQAKRAAELFTHTSIDDEKIDVIASKIASQTRNIVLIGMPGCGKTSIGASLAKKMNREFADSDEWIVMTAGKPIPAIFAEDGEDVFRKLETEALKALCKRNGLIIATGGGIVEHPENRNIIRQNGVVVFLDRDIMKLHVFGRPLSEREGPVALAGARMPLYLQWSDFTAPVHGVEQTATDIKDVYGQNVTSLNI
jgi:shikimate dehydrogenase